MPSIRLFCLTLILCFSLHFLWSQRLEVGFNGGFSAYEGDLTPSMLGDRLETVHLSFGVFGKVNIGERIAAGLAFNQLKISGDDRIYGNPRNLRFESPISEVSAMLDIHILPFDPEAPQYLLHPYVTLGLAYFQFNPQTVTQDGFVVDLQPLGTEGQGLPGNPPLYQLKQFAVPIGGGLKVAISPSVNLSAYATLRKTFTDYLDDVSNRYPDFQALLEDPARGLQAASLSDRSWEIDGNSFNDHLFESNTGRGNPDRDDWYFTFGIAVSLNLYETFSGGGKNTGRDGCPVW